MNTFDQGHIDRSSLLQFYGNAMVSQTVFSINLKQRYSENFCSLYAVELQTADSTP